MIRACTACGANNRILRSICPILAVAARAKPLPPVSEPVEVDASRFAEINREAKVPVLVDFWAEWCQPCRMSAPEVDALAREIAGRGLILKVNTEESPALAAKFRVQSIPYFVLLRGGIIIAERTGMVSRAEMRRWFATAA